MSYEVIAKHLGVEAVEGKYPFKIVDSKPDLDIHMVHYDVDVISLTPKDSPIRKLRGVIVSEENGILVPSFGYTPTIVSDNYSKAMLSPLEDKDGNTHDMKEFLVKDVFPMFDGTLLRVWMYKKQIYISSHKKIDAVNSRWGTSGKFVELFKKYTESSFDVSDLFATDDLMDPDLIQIHNFLLVDRDLMICSKLPLDTDIKSGFVLYINSLNCSFPIELPKIHHSQIPTCKETVFRVMSLKTDEECDSYLINGFYPDVKDIHPQISLGEGLILYNGSSMIKMVSNGYNRRSKIVSNDPNILHRAYDILSDTQFSKDGIDTYLEKFPAIPIPSDEQLKDCKTSIIEKFPEDWKTFADNELSDSVTREVRENRLHNAIMHYAISLPLCHQFAAMTCANDILRDRYKVIQIVTHNMEKFEKCQWGDDIFPRDLKVYERIQRIVQDAKSFARTRVRSGEKIEGMNEYNTLRKFSMDNVRNLILKEYGSSLYKMVRVLVADAK